MMRIFLAYIVPLLLPTVVYLLWLRFAPANGGGERGVPWLWLAGAGVVLAAIVLAGLALSGGSPDGFFTSVAGRARGVARLTARAVPRGAR